MDKATYHNVKHRYREEIIVPVAALSNNIDFIMDSEAEKRVLTADNVKCRVKKYKFIHVCELENEIKRLYNKGAWDFIKMWYKVVPNIYSMEFLVIKLEKINAKIE